MRKSWENGDKTIAVRQFPMILSHVYVVETPETDVFVDTGHYLERLPLAVCLFLTKRKRPIVILLTHAHVDHIANAAWLAKRLRCTVYAAADAKHISAQGISDIPHGRTTFGCMVSMFLNCRLFKPLRRFAPVQVKDVDTWQPPAGLEVIATPGHSTDGISLVIENHVCLCGDLLVKRADQPRQHLADDVRAWRQSIHVIKKRGPMLWFAGHGKYFRTM